MTTFIIPIKTIENESNRIQTIDAVKITVINILYSFDILRSIINLLHFKIGEQVFPHASYFQKKSIPLIVVVQLSTTNHKEYAIASL